MRWVCCWATRVSAVEQNADLQRDALRAADCWKVFTDHVTGTRERRSELDRLIEQLRPGDTVVGVDPVLPMLPPVAWHELRDPGAEQLALLTRSRTLSWPNP